MIKAHPSDAMLYQYAAGDLSPALSLVMATHIDMCKHCQQKVSELEERLCEKHLVNESPALANHDCQRMLDAIFASEAPEQIICDQGPAMITLEGKRFHLPATLANNADRIGDWSHMVGKLWRAPLSIGSDDSINLIYMEQGAQVPEHTHRGVEATLVLNGTFNDEFDSYHDGDFILLDASRKHSPQTQMEDCLTLAALDAPLHFTSGISRLLNPFSSLFFR
ncbi:ChrR family anti-sigma-E factor [Idiomarina xiamenensis]|uniref:Transcription negative regulator ChrR n=1 Tax=Idiomarina xiamenensis 10-D-4 TaxID=740709 RepID=K2JTX3_9GAMM|nr:ChrR family anti-sigma-E factor [Idiomarina xiamenensis]EKE86896.1 transcription negative regulator ChrR [Idiomarina xiamenensis 10-D-4]